MTTHEFRQALAQAITNVWFDRGVDALPGYFASLQNEWRDDMEKLTVIAEMGALHGLQIRTKKPSPRRVPEANPFGLRSPREAAAALRCSTKTLRRYVESGVLRYVELPSRGKRRPRRRFTDDDLTEFIKQQTQKDIPLPCPSSKTRARHIGASTSNIVALAFSDQPKPPRNGKPKR